MLPPGVKAKHQIHGNLGGVVGTLVFLSISGTLAYHLCGGEFKNEGSGGRIWFVHPPRFCLICFLLSFPHSLCLHPFDSHDRGPLDPSQCSIWCLQPMPDPQPPPPPSPSVSPTASPLHRHNPSVRSQCPKPRQSLKGIESNSAQVRRVSAGNSMKRSPPLQRRFHCHRPAAPFPAGLAVLPAKCPPPISNGGETVSHCPVAILDPPRPRTRLKHWLLGMDVGPVLTFGSHVSEAERFGASWWAKNEV